MNLRQAAVAAVSTAVATSALVGVTSTAASAVEVQNTYTCSNTGLDYSGDFPLTVNGGFPAEAPAGWSVNAELLQALASASVPENARGLLQFAKIESARSDDFAFDIGAAGKAPMPLAGDFNDDYSQWSGGGKNAAFTTPKAGTYAVTMPASFSFTTETAEGDSATLSCQLATGQQAQSLGSVTLTKQTAVLTGTGGEFKKGRVAKVKSSVMWEDTSSPATKGKVVAKKGTQKLGQATVTDGTNTIAIGKLPVGRHKIKLTYSGAGYATGDSKTVIVKVTR